MTRGQRLAVFLGSIALLLIIGRGVAVLYVDHAWYSALGASAVWASKINNTILLYGCALVIGAAFAFVNIFAVRRSIVTLTIPTRIGNIEIGEPVPPARLVYVTAAMSICAAAVSLLALPSWTTLALWRSGVSFGEIDPYFGFDLSHYVTWLPLELSLYDWAFVLYAIVALLVVTMYALTPSLRWNRSRIHVTTYARRHIGVLTGFLVAFIAWSVRIDAYRTLIQGNGPDGLFTRFDHQWFVPTNIIVSLIILGAAFVLMAAIWIGQTQAAFVIVTALLVTLALVKGMMPWVSYSSAQDGVQSKQESPYYETQRLYTGRAFPMEPTPLSIKYAADSVLLTNAPRLEVPQGFPDIVYPGARGVTLEQDSAGIIKAPRIGGIFSKLMTAWAEQNPRLLGSDLDHTAAVVRHRDVRDRIRALAPVFTQSQSMGVRPAPLGVMWIVDLYATSDTYPLSIPRMAGTTRLNYRRHVATAYVNGATGGVSIVPDTTLDPIASAWFRTHRGEYLALRSPRDSAAPIQLPLPDTLHSPVVSDSVFRTQITNIYLWMRSTLNAGDFKGFGEAFDSLGAAVGVPR